MGATTIAVTTATVASTNAIIASNNMRLLTSSGTAGDISPAMAIMVVLFIAVGFVGFVHASDAKWDSKFARNESERIRHHNSFVLRSVSLCIVMAIMLIVMILMGTVL